MSAQDGIDDLKSKQGVPDSVSPNSLADNTLQPMWDQSDSGIKALSVVYNWDSDTSIGDPGAGNIKVNNSDFNSATILSVSSVTAEGQDAGEYIKAIGVGAMFNMASYLDSTNYFDYTITQIPQDSGTWFQIQISHDTSNGSFSDGEEILSRQASSGVNGSMVNALGLGQTWSDDTAATDPGSDTVKGNNADETLITEIYVGAPRAPEIIMGLVPGDIVIFSRVGSPSFMSYIAQGYPVDNGGWYTLPVSAGSNSGGFVDGDLLAVAIASYGDRSNQVTALITTDSTIGPISTNELAPTQISTLELAPSMGLAPLTVDPVDGTITNVSELFLELDGSIAVHPNKTGGGIASLQLCSETAFDGVNFQNTPFGLRTQEITNSGETTWSTPAAMLLPPGGKLRFFLWNSGGGTLVLDSPTANPNGAPAFGSSVAITLHGRGYKV